MSEGISKSDLRRDLRFRLKEMSPKFRETASSQLEAHLATLEYWKTARRIYAFSPLTAEPDLTRWNWNGKSLALPRITESEIRFFEVPGFENLQFQALGIAEPPADALLAEPPDLILVPGLGFDRAGRRLGRGGGYYDRFLATIPSSIPRIGVGFDFQICETIPTESHDIRMNAIVTERGVSFSESPRD